MDPDVMFVTGLGLAVLSVAGAISDWSDGRRPRLPAFGMILSGGLMLWAFLRKPGGYRAQEFDEVIYSVLGRLIH